MNKKQWYTLSSGFAILGLIFIAIDIFNGSICNLGLIRSPLGAYDIWCIINMEKYDPLIILSGALWIIFTICGRFEKK